MIIVLTIGRAVRLMDVGIQRRPTVGPIMISRHTICATELLVQLTRQNVLLALHTIIWLTFGNVFCITIYNNLLFLKNGRVLTTSETTQLIEAIAIDMPYHHVLDNSLWSG